MIFKDELDRAGPVVDRVNAAIRDNPLAAGLIGAGLAWMLMGGAKGFGVMAGAATGAAKGAAGIAGSMAGSAASTAAKAGSAVASGISDAGSAGASRLERHGLRRGRFGGVACSRYFCSRHRQGRSRRLPMRARPSATRFNAAAASGREYGAAIQSRLSESLEKQPLLLGAIGLAIGAGIASTFATTAVESELMGEQGSAAREKLQGLAERRYRSCQADRVRHQRRSEPAGSHPGCRQERGGGDRR